MDSNGDHDLKKITVLSCRSGETFHHYISIKFHQYLPNNYRSTVYALLNFS